MPDAGFTHIALPVTDLDATIAFYFRCAQMKVVHRRTQQQIPEREIAWLSDLTRPFVLVLAESPDVEHPLGPFAHLGVACASRDEVDRLCELARVEGRLRDAPSGGEGSSVMATVVSRPYAWPWHGAFSVSRAAVLVFEDAGPPAPESVLH